MKAFFMKVLSFITAISLSFLVITGCSLTEPNPYEGYKVKKEYFTGGQIRSIFIMTDDSEQNGVLKKYGYDGSVTSMGYIKNGVNDGEEKWYDKKGRKILLVHYVKGKKHGVEEGYYPNGDVMMSTTYAKGLKNGEAHTFNKDGSINKQIIFKDDRVVN